jgi:glycosyltransferase involved in cell wall biosynthesis
LKIAAFVEYLPPRLGSDRRIFEIMKRLSHKHEIHFIVFPPFRVLLEKLKNREILSLHSAKETSCVNHEGINGHFIPISPRIAMMWQHSLIIAYSLTFVSVLLKSSKILKKINPDIVVLNYPSPYTGLLGFLEGKLLKKPVVLDFNDLIAQYTINLLNLKKNSLKARMLVFVQQYLVKKVQMVIAPTFFIKKYVASLRVPERKIAIIPNGVDTRDFNPHKYNISQLKTNLGLQKEKLCLYSGHLEGWAGVNIILKLCNIAMNRKLDTKFVLVGSGTLKAIPKENAVLLEEVAYEKVPAILAIADAILIPFPNNEVAHAASPLKLFEGMAMQKPVIASKVSGIQDVVLDGENGFLADPENVNEWIEKLETILTYENIAKKVGQNARRTVEEKFEWNCLAKQYEEILNSVSRIQVIKSHVD